MTVSVTHSRQPLTTNGTTGPFTFTFPIFDEGDLEVYLDYDLLTLNVDYTVNSGPWPSGGSITAVAAWDSGQELEIIRRSPSTQDTAYSPSDAFPSVATGNALDKLMLRIQELESRLSSTLRAPIYERLVDDDDLVFPMVRAGKFLAFDALGKPTVSVGTTGADSALRTDLANSVALSVGALLVGYRRSETGSVAQSVFDILERRKYVEDFGALANGSDDTAALIAAINSLEPGDELAFRSGATYMVHVNVVAHTLSIANKNSFVIRGNFATIKVFDGDPVAGDDEILFLEDCTDWLIENLDIDANRANRTPAETTAHSIEIRNNCKRGTFRKVRSLNAVCDGWIVQTSAENTESSYPDDITFDDCEGINCYRQGMSVTAAKNIKLNRGRYAQTNGTAPQCGINVEPNATTTYGVQGFRAIDVEVSENEGAGLQFTVSGGTGIVKDILVRGLKGHSNVEAYIRLTVGQDVTLESIECGPHAEAMRGLIDIQNGQLENITLRKINFHNITANGADNYCIYDQGSIVGRYVVDGVKAYAIACKLAALGSGGTFSNIDLDTCTYAGGAVTITGGTRPVLRHYTAKTVTGSALIVSAPDVEVDGLSVHNCTDAAAVAQFVAGALRPMLRNASITHSGAKPGGAHVGIAFTEVPRLVQNVIARDSGSGYTAANIMSFAAGVAGSVIDGCSPDPLSGSATYDPASLADGAGATTTVTVTGAALGDYPAASFSLDLQGITLTAWVSAANTVSVRFQNESGGVLDLASGTLRARVRKAA